ncbi:carboxylesterase family protein [Janibacter limosus]|uniref:carboxylesterase family protein n=1 Tax=Janibacter limosus TaxID=53458 RepID=UPI000A6DFF13|nr:carboxylesterase family protein [Janibacter limosus]
MTTPARISRSASMTKGEPPTWSAPAGEIVGRRDGDVLRAGGIRYARAARFAPPVAEAPVDRIDATRMSPACPQPRVEFLEEVLGLTPGELPFDEDCLRLSVTVPADSTADESLPVMVMIHGGSYVSGAGDLEIYDPGALVTEQRVVVVRVTYRLGLLGYLGDGSTRPANLGLLDQIAALRWVRTNIGAFGGDPDEITLFGQSAGGDAIAHLMIAEGTEGLFRRAIIQSPPIGVMPGRSAMTDAMMHLAQSLTDETDIEDVLAAQPSVEPSVARHGMSAGMPFGVQYGHHPLPAEEDLDAAWSEAAERVDVLIGSTDREASLFIAKALGGRALGPWAAPFVRRVGHALTERIYGRGVLAFAERHHAAGGRGQRYLITWGVPGNPYAGAHTIELPLLQGELATWRDAALLAGVDPDDFERSGRRLRQIFADFARTGDVGVISEPGLIEVRELPVD